jgi:hypothetical protein
MNIPGKIGAAFRNGVTGLAIFPLRSSADVPIGPVPAPRSLGELLAGAAVVAVIAGGAWYALRAIRRKRQ